MSASAGATHRPPRAILFDWDNTLVDNWASIHDALNATFQAFDLPPWTLAQTKGRVRRSLRDSFPAVFGTSWEKAAVFFQRHFHDRHLETLRHLPGAPELLSELTAAGIYLGVVSNKNGAVLRREAEHLGWTGHFGRIVGAADAARDKPSGDPVLMALERSGFSAGPDVWFVGDAGVDMECAHATGCLPVLISAVPYNTEEFQSFPPAISPVDLAGLGSFLRVCPPPPL